MSDLDPCDIRSSEEVEVLRKKKQDQTRFQESEDFKWLMSDKRGRRFIWRLLSLTGLFLNAFTGNSETFFRCGKAAIGQTVFAEINMLCPEKYELMVKENAK